jgi:hypothetical protein
MKGNMSLQCFNHISKVQSFALGYLIHSAPAVQEFKVLLDHAYGDTLRDHHSSTDSVDSTELQKGVAVPPDL